MIQICQLLCPQRHCIIAAAFDPMEKTLPDVVIEMGVLLTKNGIRKQCGICGSKEVVFESRPTKFKTMEEAIPALQQNEKSCMKSRALLDAMGISYDVQQKIKSN